MTVNNFIPWLILLPLMGAFINGVFGSKLPKTLVYAVACIPVLAGAAMSGLLLWMVADKDMRIAYDMGTWFSAGDVSIGARFAVDQLSGIMICVITGIGSLIHLYSTEYMDEDPSVHRYFAYLNMFVAAMLVLVLGDNMVLMFVGWEGVGLCSYLLIGFWFEDEAKASAGKKAFVVNRIGDFGVILGTIALILGLGTADFGSLKAGFAGLNAAQAHNLALVAGLLLFLGAAGKSAQIPLYVWLPDAMAGPTPVSALIHAATMVTAGIYMICRLSFMYVLAPEVLAVVAIIGSVTALFAASMGLMQTDIKKVLAYSTVSQLGYMFLGVGVGAFSAGFFHVFTHAFFKACLFLGSGAVIHALHHEQDIRKMGGLARKLPITCATFTISTLAIMGFPGFSGFFSKDEIMWQAFQSGLEGAPYAHVFGGLNYVLFGIAFLTAAMTSFYMWRVTLLTFWSGKYRGDRHTFEHAHESPLMSMALIVLAIGALAAGFLNVPHVFGGHASLSEFLSPVMGHLPEAEGHHAPLEWGLMGATFLAIMGSAGFAWMLFGRDIAPNQKRILDTLPGTGLVKVLFNKWYVDEAYEAAVIKPMYKFSYIGLYKVVDRFLIDGFLVGLVAAPGKYGGYLFRWIQNGSMQRYATVFMLGAVTAIVWVVLR